jgi:hypothetical protein
MAAVSVRYIVHDVDAAIAFHCHELGFDEGMRPAPTGPAILRLPPKRLKGLEPSPQTPMRYLHHKSRC